MSNIVLPVVKVGTSKSTIVCEARPDWLPVGTGHDEVKYYGGYLIAESIPEVAVPTIVKACNNYERMKEMIVRLSNQMKCVEPQCSSDRAVIDDADHLLAELNKTEEGK